MNSALLVESATQPGFRLKSDLQSARSTGFNAAHHFQSPMKKLSLLSVVIVFSLESARAATVTTTADDGPGSLRDAIKNAAVGATIDFGISGVITLTSGELAVTTNLTIAGPGASHLMEQRSTTSGTPGFRIFSIQSGPILVSGLGLDTGLASLGVGLNDK